MIWDNFRILQPDHWTVRMGPLDEPVMTTGRNGADHWTEPKVPGFGKVWNLFLVVNQRGTHLPFRS